MRLGSSTVISLAYLAGLTASTLLATPTFAQEAEPHVHDINGPRKDAPIPRPGMTLVKGQCAIVVTDPQNDFLSPKGVAGGVVGKSVTERRTVKYIDSLFRTAKSAGVPILVGPHCYYHHDHQWKFEGALEAMMHTIGMFDRQGGAGRDRGRGLGRALA